MENFNKLSDLDLENLLAEDFIDISLNNLSTWNLELDKWLSARYMYPTAYPLMSDDEYSVYCATYNLLAECGYQLTEKSREALQFDKIMNYLELYYEGDSFPEQSLLNIGFSKDLVEVIRNLKQEVIKPEWVSITSFLEEKIEIDGIQYDKYSEEICDIIEDMISEDPAKSIKPLETKEDVWKWFSSKINVEILTSLKMDGVNIRLFYINGYFVRALTRGRTTGEVQDYTAVISKIVPHYIKGKDGKGVTGIIRGEIYVKPSSLPYFRDNYKGSYVVPRSAVITLLCKPHKEEDYKYLQFHSFNYKYGDSLEDGFKFLEEQGFLTAPRKLVKFNGNTFEEFKIWVDDLLNDMHNIEVSEDKKCDGLVAEINSREEYEKLIVDGMYNDGNIAMKIGPWKPAIYTAVIKNLLIDCDKSKMRFYCKAEIEPVVVQSGITVTKVNMFNLGLVQQYGIKVGSEIKFKFKNDNAIQWCYQEI